MKKKKTRRAPKKPGILFIISAPSGAGKTTLVRALSYNQPKLLVSISCTTRPKRPGEENGVDYCFVHNARFDEMIKQDQFLEYATVFDNRYGTPRDWVEDQLKAGNDVMLEIDWQGARNIRKLKPECKSIFILPPAIAILEQRLRSRKEDLDSTIERRTKDALAELSHYKEFDYLVVNDDIKMTLKELTAIINACRRGVPYTTPDYQDFAKQLMTEGSKIK